MPSLRLFASIREVAGTREIELPGATVSQVISAATDKFGDSFAELVPTCRIWVNGEPALEDDAVETGDEVALLPPVSGG